MCIIVIFRCFQLATYVHVHTHIANYIYANVLGEHQQSTLCTTQVLALGTLTSLNCFVLVMVLRVKRCGLVYEQRCMTVTPECALLPHTAAYMCMCIGTKSIH